MAIVSRKWGWRQAAATEVARGPCRRGQRRASLAFDSPFGLGRRSMWPAMTPFISQTHPKELILRDNGSGVLVDAEAKSMNTRWITRLKDP